MIKFGIDKLDDIVCQDRKVYILHKGRKGTGYPNFEMRFCEYGLLKNLLEENIPCGVIHLTYGDTFQNMYQTILFDVKIISCLKQKLYGKL